MQNILLDKKVKIIPVLFICAVSLFSMGCAGGFNLGAGMNASCGHVVASGSYATAQGNGAGFACHEGCFGFNCPVPDYSKVTLLATTYMNSENAVTTTIPIMVALAPTATPTIAAATTPNK